MIDPKDLGKCPWVRSSFFGIVNENALFIKGDVDNVLVLLNIVCREVDPHDWMFVEYTILDDEFSVMIAIIQRVRREYTCIEMLLEVGEEVLCRSL